MNDRSAYTIEKAYEARGDQVLRFLKAFSSVKTEIGTLVFLDRDYVSRGTGISKGYVSFAVQGLKQHGILKPYRIMGCFLLEENDDEAAAV